MLVFPNPVPIADSLQVLANLLLRAIGPSKLVGDAPYLLLELIPAVLSAFVHLAGATPHPNNLPK